MDRSLQVMFVLLLASFGVLGLFLLMPVGSTNPMHGEQPKAEVQQDGSAEKDFTIVSREEWGARPPTSKTEMPNPVPYVIIHHSYIPGACYSPEECEEAMRKMQSMHQDTNGWVDIGYSFGIGGDNRIYMGRGWSLEGAHAPHYNNRSIGICFIGDWRYVLPTSEVLESARRLIEFGVNEGYIHPDYELFGHRQVREGTECPGDALFDEITTWPQWCEEVPYKHMLPSDENKDE